MTQTKVLRLALEFFETMQRYKGVRSKIFIRFEPTATGDYLNLQEFDERAKPVITAIKAALLSRSDGEAKDEPVQNQLMALIDENQRLRAELKFNTTPPQRKPLTDEEIERIYNRYGGEMINCARAIERAHGIKGEA